MTNAQDAENQPEKVTGGSEVVGIEKVRQMGRSNEVVERLLELTAEATEGMRFTEVVQEHLSLAGGAGGLADAGAAGAEAGGDVAGLGLAAAPRDLGVDDLADLDAQGGPAEAKELQPVAGEVEVDLAAGGGGGEGLGHGRPPG